MSLTKRIACLVLMLMASALLSCVSVPTDQDAESTDPTSKGKPSSEETVGRLILNWKTESEEDNYGFYIFRSESQDGPWVQINKDIVPGGGTTNIPQTYRYLDYPLEIDKTYFYYLQEVSYAGVRKTFTPVIQKDAGPLKESELEQFKIVESER